VPIILAIAGKIFAWRGTKWVLVIAIVLGLISVGVVRMRAHVRAKAIEAEQLRQSADNAKALGDAVIRDLEREKAEREVAARARKRAGAAAQSHAEIERWKHVRLETPDITAGDVGRWEKAIDEQEQRLRARGVW
jgi:hypothetical protein